MAKAPAFAKAFTGRWRIVEMDVWENDFLDLVEEAHLTFRGKSDGEIAFGEGCAAREVQAPCDTSRIIAAGSSQQAQTTHGEHCGAQNTAKLFRI